jgi:hypothetical protein
MAAFGATLDSEAAEAVDSSSAVALLFLFSVPETCPKQTAENRRKTNQQYRIPVVSPVTNCEMKS